MLKVKELRDQTVEELRVLVRDLQKEVFDLKNKLSIDRKLSQPHLIKQKKRDCARVLTVLSEKEVQNDK